jgi:hypothetical protein
MTDFSTRATLDVAVSERSLSNARDQLESSLGSVRSSIDPAMSGGGRGGVGGGLRDTLVQQTDVLIQIRDTLEEQAFNAAAGGGGGGGATILGGLGGLKGLGIGAAAGGGLLGLGATALDTVLKDALNSALGGFLSESQNFQDTSLVSQVFGGGGPLGLAQSFGEAAGNHLVDWAGRAGSSLVQDLTSIEFAAPQWLEDLMSFRLTEPEWLSNLTSFRLREPEWISQLTSLFGGGGGAGPVAPSAVDRGLAPSDQRLLNNATRGRRTGGQSLDLSIETAGLQRDLERAVGDALGNLGRNRAFQNAVEAIIRDVI